MRLKVLWHSTFNNYPEHSYVLDTHPLATYRCYGSVAHIELRRRAFSQANTPQCKSLSCNFSVLLTAQF